MSLIFLRLPEKPAKLALQWIGPYRVLKQVSTVNFKLSKVGSTKTEIVNKTKKFFVEGFPHEETIYVEDDENNMDPYFQVNERTT